MLEEENMMRGLYVIKINRKSKTKIKKVEFLDYNKSYLGVHFTPYLENAEIFRSKEEAEYYIIEYLYNFMSFKNEYDLNSLTIIPLTLYEFYEEAVDINNNYDISFIPKEVEEKDYYDYLWDLSCNEYEIWLEEKKN